MKAIVVSEVTFEMEFERLLEKLELAKFKERQESRADGRDSLESLHRKFVYEIVAMKQALKNG